MKKNIILITVTALLIIFTSQTSFSHFLCINDNLEIVGDEIDGLYSGTAKGDGISIIATLRITGKKWIATSKMNIPGATTEYQRGIMVGVDIYDESGFVKIGYVSENTAYINGYPEMTKETN